MKALKQILLPLLGIAATATLSSCHAIYDDEGDCAANYRVRFIDDMNLKYADAFDAEVQSMSLYVFNSNGEMVYYDAQNQDVLTTAGDNYHCMDISSLAPGKYHVVAWGGVHEGSSFTLPTMSSRASRMSDLTCKLKRSQTLDNDYDLVNEDLDDLFHGAADIVISEADEPGTHTFDIHLTKNTHRVSVVLQQLNGEALSPTDYDFYIEANNGHLNYDNSVMHDEKRFLYTAFEKAAGKAGVYDESAQISSVSAVVARHTVSRLQVQDWDKYERPTLTVYNAHSGEKVLSIPLIDYALLVRPNYPKITTDQEFLDRQDEYNFVFFLNDGRWLDSVIEINSWRIVFNNDDLQSQK